MALLFTNNGQSTLASGISNSATTIVVASGQGALFPLPTSGNTFRATLVRASDGAIEIVDVTARSTDTMTVTRAQEGTTGLAFLAGDRFECRITAGFLNSLQNPVVQTLTSPTVIGGTDTTSALILQPTSGVGTTGADIIWRVGNNGATQAGRVLNNGMVYIGSAGNPVANGGLEVATASANITAIAYTDGTGTGGNINLKKARGAVGAPTPVLSGDVLGGIFAAGYTSAGRFGSNVGLFRYEASEDFTGAAQGSRLTMYTTPNGSTTRVERVRLDQDGAWLINTTTNNGTDKLQVAGSGYLSGSLGIGAALNVAGSAKVSSLMSLTRVNTQEVQFDGGSNKRWRLISGINGAADGNMTLQYTTDGFASNFTNAAVFGSSGNVGFGTTPAAGYNVDVFGTDAKLRIRDSGQANGLEIYQQNSDGGSRIFATNNNYLELGTNNAGRLRIDSVGGVGVGLAPAVGTTLTIAKSLTGAASTNGVWVSAAVLSDSTTNAFAFRSNISTQAAAFTLPALVHYYAQQSTIGAGSTVTNQYGYHAESSLIGATNNYGFYGNIPSGTNRWNFYSAGTAANYFAGSVGIGSLAAATGQFKLVVGGTHNGSTNARGIGVLGSVDPAVVTSAYTGFISQPSVSAGTLPAIFHFYATPGTYTGAVTAEYGYYGNIASGNGRYNLYMAGTAQNVFNGDVLVIGGSAGLGYGTGAGGTVTQATSRTTGVTLNKTTGAITLVSAAGTATWQSFTVTNSTVAANDVVLPSQKSGTDRYMIEITNVAAGSFQISYATTGGTTTEQPVFSFAVIKGATA